MVGKRFVVMAGILLTLALCLLLVLAATGPSVNSSLAATQTEEKRKLDEYMTIYSPGGVTAAAPPRVSPPPGSK